ncbi:MAG TPA: response regulator [Roseiflexaceae bacterium]|nr:response regulator [Roseiflexaceae bacterium]
MAKVLIVDDEDVLLEMIAALIEELGYHPLTATNGREALDTLHALGEPPALILSDVMMPRMNGVEFARAIKSDPRFQHVPIVLMSAAGPPHHDHLAEQFIHKPFDVDYLSALIERYVSNNHRHSGRAMGW